MKSWINSLIDSSGHPYIDRHGTLVNPQKPGLVEAVLAKYVANRIHQWSVLPSGPRRIAGTVADHFATVQFFHTGRPEFYHWLLSSCKCCWVIKRIQNACVLHSTLLCACIIHCQWGTGARDNRVDPQRGKTDICDGNLFCFFMQTLNFNCIHK